MGQYFLFLNLKTNEPNQKPIYANYGLCWSKFPDNDEGKAFIFEEVIENNSWTQSDEILAVGDYGHEYLFSNGIVRRDSRGLGEGLWDSFNKAMKDKKTND